MMTTATIKANTLASTTLAIPSLVAFKFTSEKSTYNIHTHKNGEMVK